MLVLVQQHGSDTGRRASSCEVLPGPANALFTGQIVNGWAQYEEAVVVLWLLKGHGLPQ